MSVVLPINPDDRFERYTATAGQKQFAIPFPFQDARDVTVLLLQGLDWIAIDDALYVIAGAGDPEGGTVTFLAGRAAGDIIAPLGKAVLDRLSSVVRDGRFQSKLTDDEFDRNRIIQQEQQRDIDRSAKSDYGEDPFTFDSNISDNSSLKVVGKRIVAGPDVAAGDAILAAAIAAEIAARIQADLLETRLRIAGDLALSSLIGQAGPIEVPDYDSRTAAALASIKPTIMTIRTGGETDAGDGRDALFHRVNVEPSHDQYFADHDGNGWWELVGFRLQESNVPRPYHSRQRDMVSALDAMANGGLDAAVRNREATAADAAEITANFADVAAFCASKGWKMGIPGGDFFLNARIDIEAPISIEGDGSTESNLKWIAGAASAGMSVVSGESQRKTTIKGIGLYALGAAIGTGLAIDCGQSFNTSVNRSKERVGLEDIITSQEGTGYWTIGINLIDCVLSSLRRHTHLGYLTSASAAEALWTGTALKISGDTDHQPAQLFASHLNYTAVHDAVQSTECEGLYFSQYEFPTCWKGITLVNDTVNTGNAGLTMTDGHINARAEAIDLTNVTDYRIDNIVFYLRASPTVDTSVIKIGTGCNRGKIVNSLFRYSTTAATVTAIDVQGGTRLDIDANQFDVGAAMGVGINIAAAASYTDIGKQTWLSALHRVIDAGQNTTTAERYGYAGSLNDITLSSYRSEQVHHLVIGATNGPGGESASGATVVTYSSASAGVAHQMFFSGSSAAVYRRRWTGSAWDAWVQL